MSGIRITGVWIRFDDFELFRCGYIVFQFKKMKSNLRGGLKKGENWNTKTDWRKTDRMKGKKRNSRHTTGYHSQTLLVVSITRVRLLLICSTFCVFCFVWFFLFFRVIARCIVRQAWCTISKSKIRVIFDFVRWFVFFHWTLWTPLNTSEFRFFFLFNHIFQNVSAIHIKVLKCGSGSRGLTHYWFPNKSPQ